MAESELEILLRLRNEASEQLNQVNDQLKGLGVTGDTTAVATDNLSKTYTGMGRALRSIIPHMTEMKNIMDSTVPVAQKLDGALQGVGTGMTFLALQSGMSLGSMVTAIGGMNLGLGMVSYGMDLLARNTQIEADSAKQAAAANLELKKAVEDLDISTIKYYRDKQLALSIAYPSITIYSDSFKSLRRLTQEAIEQNFPKYQKEVADAFGWGTQAATEYAKIQEVINTLMYKAGLTAGEAAAAFNKAQKEYYESGQAATDYIKKITAAQTALRISLELISTAEMEQNKERDAILDYMNATKSSYEQALEYIRAQTEETARAYNETERLRGSIMAANAARAGTVYPKGKGLVTGEGGADIRWIAKHGGGENMTEEEIAAAMNKYLEEQGVATGKYANVAGIRGGQAIMIQIAGQTVADILLPSMGVSMSNRSVMGG